MDNKTNVAEQTSKSKVCFKCGEQLKVQTQTEEEFMCGYCEETTDLSPSHFYMLQYYYQYAD